jgi:poly(3-hydroxybutyrate) depolymerase
MDAGKFHHESGVARQFGDESIGKQACAEVFSMINIKEQPVAFEAVHLL